MVSAVVLAVFAMLQVGASDNCTESDHYTTSYRYHRISNGGGVPGRNGNPSAWCLYEVRFFNDFNGTEELTVTVESAVSFVGTDYPGKVIDGDERSYWWSSLDLSAAQYSASLDGAQWIIFEMSDDVAVSRMEVVQSTGSMFWSVDTVFVESSMDKEEWTCRSTWPISAGVNTLDLTPPTLAPSSTPATTSLAPAPPTPESTTGVFLGGASFVSLLPAVAFVFVGVQ